jgi:ATP-dependent DNA helicase DinG
MDPIKKSHPASKKSGTVAGLFSAGGALSGPLKGFEPRPQQIQMAMAVESALAEEKPLLVEAGTGVGKSLAYLLPAALWAVRENKRVWVSTHTKALQEQLLNKDLPLTHAVLKSAGLDLRYGVLMGAGNYLCVDRLKRAGTLWGGQNERILKTLSGWAETADTALRAHLPCAVPDALWETVCRDADLCLAKGTPLEARCLYQKDLALARKAHVVVVNHALFFAGLPLKPADAVILDEAHTLEDAASRFLGYDVSNVSLKRLWDDLFAPDTGRGLSRRLGGKRLLERAVHVARGKADEFFALLDPQVGFSDGEPQKRMRSPLRGTEGLEGALSAIESLLLDDLAGAANSEEEADLRRHLHRVRETRTHLCSFSIDLRADHAYWAERTVTRRGPRLSLHGAPVDLAPFLKERIVTAFPRAVLTSATLTVGGSFESARARFGIESCAEAMLDSPFDYKNRAALFVDPDTPDPKSDPLGHEAFVLARCRALAAVVPGGLFILFTSWSFLERAHRALLGEVGSRPLFKQGAEAPSRLLEHFKKAGNGILLGTDTFWQGVDVPGSALSCVVITRLPFTPPTAPLEEARQEWLEKQGHNVFSEYTIPRAVIKFRQGFGRLIRSQRDTGAVVILDPRVRTKPYGRVFLKSLPGCRPIGSLEDLANFFQRSESGATFSGMVDSPPVNKMSVGLGQNKL